MSSYGKSAGLFKDLWRESDILSGEETMVLIERKYFVVATLMAAVLAGYNNVRASSDTAATIDVLALSLGIELTDSAIQIEQTALSEQFRKTFRTLATLTPALVVRYIKEKPSELLAFRDYCQQLHNSGYLSYGETVTLVRSAFQGYSQNESSDASEVARKRTSPPIPLNSQDPNVYSVSELAIRDSVNGVDQVTLSPPTYEFGEDIQREQDEAAQVEAARLVAELEADKRRKRLEAQAAYLMRELARSKPPKQTLMERVNSILNQHAQEVVQEKADEVFDNAEISITSTGQSPQFNARVLKAFDANPDDGLFNYGEIGLRDINDRQTLNVGFGIRLTDPSETVMYGANVFFDQEFPHNHQRASAGVEVVTSPFRLNANRYFALSGGKGLSGDTTEKALSGQDIKTKIAFPYLPYLFLDYSKFQWFGKDGLADITGQTIGISGALSDSLSIDFARKTYSHDDIASQNTARLTYHYIPKSEKTASVFSPMSVPYTFEKLDAREKYAMTNRENEIQKQQTKPDLQVTFTSL
jgi:hypothetical protein